MCLDPHPRRLYGVDRGIQGQHVRLQGQIEGVLWQLRLDHRFYRNHWAALRAISEIRPPPRPNPLALSLLRNTFNLPSDSAAIAPGQLRFAPCCGPASISAHTARLKILFFQMKIARSALKSKLHQSPRDPEHSSSEPRICRLRAFGVPGLPSQSL